MSALLAQRPSPLAVLNVAVLNVAVLNVAVLNAMKVAIAYSPAFARAPTTFGTVSAPARRPRHACRSQSPGRRSS